MRGRLAYVNEPAAGGATAAISAFRGARRAAVCCAAARPTRPMWSRRQDGSFLAYSADVNATIETAYQSGAPSVIVSSGFLVRFDSMRQVQTKDESLWRPVRRAAASDDEPPPKRSRVEPPPAAPPPASSALDAFFDDDPPLSKRVVDPRDVDADGIPKVVAENIASLARRAAGRGANPRAFLADYSEEESDAAVDAELERRSMESVELLSASTAASDSDKI